MRVSSTYPLPTANEQLLFLQRIQLLLTDATFTSTYKFALLLAISELSVEIGQDTGEPLAIPISALADKTIELYWQQTLPTPLYGYQEEHYFSQIKNFKLTKMY